MKLRLSINLLPLAAAALSAAATNIAQWDRWKSGVLPALSIIAAAALVRLARGIPVNNPELYEPRDVIQIVGTLKRAVRSMRSLVYVTLATMIFLDLASQVIDEIDIYLTPGALIWIRRACCACQGLFVSYIFVHIFRVVQGDVRLVDRQAEMLIAAVTARQLRKTQIERS